MALGPEGPSPYLAVPGSLTADPTSPYHDTMTEHWLDNGPAPVAFTVDDAQASAVEIVTMRP